MINKITDRIYGLLGNQKILLLTLNLVGRKKGYFELQKKLENVNDNIFNQYTGATPNSAYYLRKLWNQHCFQAKFTVNALKKHVLGNTSTHLSLVDIGDSAGNHLKYVKQLLKDSNVDIDAVSVNLDPVAIDKINSRGGTLFYAEPKITAPNLV